MESRGFGNSRHSRTGPRVDQDRYHGATGSEGLQREFEDPSEVSQAMSQDILYLKELEQM